ncbi:MAG: CpaF family protein [Anaerolineaceae bacterium]|nr:MAG: CpaF family protein [Anaerolineaceae bacterium]
MSLLKRIEKGDKDPSGGKGKGGDKSPPPSGGGRTNRTVGDTGGAPAGKTTQASYADLKTRVQNRLLGEINQDIETQSKDEIRRHIEELFHSILAEEGVMISRQEKKRLFDSIVSDIIGFGPIDPLLRDEAVSEIMVNGPKMIYVERKGLLSRVNLTFDNDTHVLRIIDRIVAPLGRRVDESSPLVDARLPDGSRVNIVIRPIALNGPTITIRKFEVDPLTVNDLIKFGSMTGQIADFLRACVIARLNMVVSGGTGSGKTTLLNVLSSFIPNDERIITVENAAELQLQQDHVVTLESRPSNIEGKGAISIQDLVINCLRMRPERIIVGECRGGEALDMLQAMNTGHDGSLTTLHANAPRDAISRLEVMCLMAGMELPTRAIREQIASAVDVICQQSRLRDGSRKILYITEVQGMEGEMITMSDIFEFQQTSYEAGKIVGSIKPTGIRPKFIEQIEDAGIHLPPSTFGLGKRR